MGNVFECVDVRGCLHGLKWQSVLLSCRTSFAAATWLLQWQSPFLGLVHPPGCRQVSSVKMFSMEHGCQRIEMSNK